MDLILWRHAEAEDGGPDLERRLTPKGRKHAERMAAWLLQRLPAKFLVLASPARRAQETARALGVPCRTLPELAPGARVRDILTAAEWPQRRNAVVVVGHQPDLGRAAAFLVSGAEAPWTVKKGGLWWVTKRVRDDEAQVVVRAVAAPDLL
ncbi:MAG: histidine phosphatase family protein [Betaproteobacteria bacterium]|nr:histidine phosphatase family protein [Betaproteobacteria bacterium]MDH5221950.1 histidine phosphatase family protein [Betaproteobacteria bacterium]MDH5349513.1 histidine phosphatase family protein [Betaproteobacteria bacterium]